jgi:hypothetical protein
MKKFLDKSFKFEDITVEGQRLLRVAVCASNLRDWCLCLQLLHDKQIEAFVIPRDSTSHRLEVSHGITTRCFQGEEKDRITVALCERDLDFVKHFYFRYYRDGMAEVDHIDIETDDGSYLILSAEDSIPPVSSDEAKRRLGI